MQSNVLNVPFVFDLNQYVLNIIASTPLEPGSVENILIFLIRTADKLNIDVADFVWRKIEINEKRYPVDRVKGSARRASDYD